jgi:hypothetical protein
MGALSCRSQEQTRILRCEDPIASTPVIPATRICRLASLRMPPLWPAGGKVSVWSFSPLCETWDDEIQIVPRGTILLRLGIGI